MLSVDYSYLYPLYACLDDLDEFDDVQNFLMKFDSIDTNIDVLVIADRNLESVDKKRFFEEVCVMEPNLRIVIVFPGYRNEYIEEQIAEYKALGIYEMNHSQVSRHKKAQFL